MKTPLHIGGVTALGWFQGFQNPRDPSGEDKICWSRVGDSRMGPDCPLSSLSSFALSLREISWNELPEEQSAALTGWICFPFKQQQLPLLPISPTLKPADSELNIHKNPHSRAALSSCCDPQCARPSPSSWDLSFLVPNLERKKKNPTPWDPPEKAVRPLVPYPHVSSLMLP